MKYGNEYLKENLHLKVIYKDVIAKNYNNISRLIDTDYHLQMMICNNQGLEKHYQEILDIYFLIIYYFFFWFYAVCLMKNTTENDLDFEDLPYSIFIL